MCVAKLAMCSSWGHILETSPDAELTLQSVQVYVLLKTQSSSPLAPQPHWRMAPRTHAHAHTRASAWPRRPHADSRALWGGGIRVWRWGWAGTGGRTDGSSAGSKRASRAFFAVFSLCIPFFFACFPLLRTWADNHLRSSSWQSFEILKGSGKLHFYAQESTFLPPH